MFSHEAQDKTKMKERRNKKRNRRRVQTPIPSRKEDSFHDISPLPTIVERPITRQPASTKRASSSSPVQTTHDSFQVDSSRQGIDQDSNKNTTKRRKVIDHDDIIPSFIPTCLSSFSQETRPQRKKINKRHSIDDIYRDRKSFSIHNDTVSSHRDANGLHRDAFRSRDVFPRESAGFHSLHRDKEGFHRDTEGFHGYTEGFYRGTSDSHKEANGFHMDNGVFHRDTEDFNRERAGYHRDIGGFHRDITGPPRDLISTTSHHRDAHGFHRGPFGFHRDTPGLHRDTDAIERFLMDEREKSCRLDSSFYSEMKKSNSRRSPLHYDRTTAKSPLGSPLFGELKKSRNIDTDRRSGVQSPMESGTGKGCDYPPISEEHVRHRRRPIRLPPITRNVNHMG